MFYSLYDHLNAYLCLLSFDFRPFVLRTSCNPFRLRQACVKISSRRFLHFLVNSSGPRCILNVNYIRCCPVNRIFIGVVSECVSWLIRFHWIPRFIKFFDDEVYAFFCVFMLLLWLVEINLFCDAMRCLQLKFSWIHLWIFINMWLWNSKVIFRV